MSFPSKKSMYKGTELWRTPFMGKKEDEPAKGMKRKFKKAKNPVSETKGMFPVGIYGCFKFYMGFKLAENLKKKIGVISKKSLPRSK